MVLLMLMLDWIVNSSSLLAVDSPARVPHPLLLWMTESIDMIVQAVVVAQLRGIHSQLVDGAVLVVSFFDALALLPSPPLQLSLSLSSLRCAE
tara:strand:- start:180 stop:458 length:279 start_codon:yes stop_codon:yes gene_type:complete